MKAFKILLVLFFLNGLGLKMYSQFNWVEIGVDGLTCSACSRSVEMSIRKLSFVDSVSMNLENTRGKISFKKGEKVEIEKIAKAVTDAGFSLRSLYAGINITELNVSNDYCWTFENSAYHFIKISESKQFKGFITIKFIGEKYMPHKEYKDWKSYCTNSCVLPSNSVRPTSRSYHVSLL